MDDKIYAGNRAIFANGEKYTLTNHAQHRVNTRTVTKEEIAEALENPKRTRTHDDAKGKCFSIVGKNFLKVVVSENNVIITVIKTSKEYTNAKVKQKRNKRSVKDRKKYGNRSRNN